MRIWLIVALGCMCWFRTVSAQMMDASNFDQAVAMVSLHGRIIDERRKYCGRYFPDQKRVINYYSLLWSDKNEFEIDAVESYLSNQDKKNFYDKQAKFLEPTMSALNAITILVSRRTACEGFIKQLQEGTDNVAKKTPKASQYLTNYLKDHPLQEIEKQKANHMMGCVKQGFNKGADFDAAVPVCRCITNTTYSNLTIDELKEADRVARAGGDSEALPQSRRLFPLLMQCKGAAAAQANGFIGRAW